MLLLKGTTENQKMTQSRLNNAVTRIVTPILYIILRNYLMTIKWIKVFVHVCMIISMFSILLCIKVLEIP